MPEFVLNEYPSSKGFDSLDEFERAYVEAMFFTNGDTGDDNEHLLNELGVGRLTRKSIANIKHDCDLFRRKTDYNPDLSAVLKDLAERDTYTLEQMGRDFWYTRQGHGVGFWSRDALEPWLGERLSEYARQCGESYVEVYRGWIYVR